MKPLSKIREMLMWLCLCPFDETISKRQQSTCIIFSLIFFGANVCAAAVSLAYLIKYLNIDLEECLYVLIQVYAHFASTYSMIVIFLRRQQINDVFQQLSRIYDECKTFSIF